MNLLPPFFFNVRVQHVAEHWSEVRVVLKLRPWSHNYAAMMVRPRSGCLPRLPRPMMPSW
jgi:hypothetical protein